MKPEIMAQSKDLEPNYVESLTETFTEMMTAFVPYEPSRDDQEELLLKTTDDIVSMVQPMLSIDRKTVVHLLHNLGYHTQYEANGWAWMMKLKK